MKKSSIILSLLTLTATLVSLPALGELTYLKKNTPYIEKVPIKEITSLVSNNHAKIENLLDDNKNTEWISWQEKEWYTQDYINKPPFEGIAVDGLGTTSSTAGGKLTVSEIPTGSANRQARQFRLFDYTKLSTGITYKLNIRYRGSIASKGQTDQIKVLFGENTNSANDVSVVESLVVSTDWVEKEIEFNLPDDVAAGSCYVVPGTYPGLIEVDKAELSYLDPNAEARYNFDYTTDNYGVTDNYISFEDGWLVAEFTTGFFQFPITPSTLRLKPNTTYKVVTNIKGSVERPNVQWWLGSGATEYGTATSLSYTTEFEEREFTFTTPNETDVDANGYINKNIVLKIQSFGKHDKIEIKSVKIYEYQKEDNNGSVAYTVNDSDNDYTKAVDGIIYSYPLPYNKLPRKVIVAYEGGLAFQTGRVYTVSYNIKYSVDGTLKTELHETLNGAATIIGNSDEIKIKAGESQNVRSTIIATGSVPGGHFGAVVLDLGYNVGSVEVTDLKVYDSTSEVRTQSSTPSQTWTQTSEINPNRNMTTQLVEVMNGLTLHNEETYTVTVKLKATKAGSLCMKLGSAYQNNARRVMNIDFEGPKENATISDWQLLTFTASPDRNDGGNPLNYNNNGTLSLQLQKQPNADEYDGEVTIQLVKISSDKWEDDETVFSINYANVDNYPYPTFPNSVYPKVENGQLIVTEWGGDRSFRIAENLGDFDQAKSYKMYMTSEASDATTIRVKFGQNNAMAVGYLPVTATAANASNINQTILDDEGQFFTIAKDGFLELQTRCADWSVSPASTIKIKDLRLATNKNEQVTWFTNGAGTATGLESYGIRYTNYNITADGLVLNPQFTTKEIINNIPFKLGKLYNAQFDINAPEGKYLVTLGDQSQEINISEEDTPGEDGFVHKTVEFGSITDDNGSLTIMPLQYVGSLQLRNGEVASYITDVDAGDMIGTDFFTVQLGDNYTMESGKNYFFHIGYVPTVSEGAFCTPRKFLIKWSTDGTNYQNLGTYEVGEGDNGNAYIGTVNDPIRNIPNGTRSLRFYCLENNADKTAICFDNKENYVTKDENGQINPTAGYIGYMMRLTRFAIYRQDEIIDPQGATTNTWALPLLTRFQIEANGQKYAYPGARLRDMIGIHKGYSNTAELFGLDTRYITEGYWDTTLPYNQQVGVAAEGGMNRDYEDDKIESPYDCIDLLLPDLNKLRATSNQIYVSMAQAKGTIENTYPVYRTYENTVEDRFLDKSNGFPTEIMYQGFITKADGTKELQGDAIVMNLFTFPETIVNNNNTINYNVANFALTIGEGWDGVRIWCRENVGDLERIHGKKTYELKSSPDNRYHTVYQENIYDSEVEPNTRMMRFAIIQAYVEIPKIHLEGDNPYPYHLLYNSRENFEDITWNHTRGIIADINNDGYMKKSQDGKHTWQDVIDDNKADLEKHDIALPNFNFYDSPFDDPYVTVTKDDGYTEKGKRQRTYTILHEVQVLPGERVDLYPQSDIWKTYKDLINKDFGDGSGINYEEQFVRWYDYLTDDAPDYLYFFSEPKSVIKTNDFGFIGGKTLLDHEQRGLGTVASVYFKQSDLDAFNKSGEESNIYFKKVNGETRLKDQYVAADFSLTFNTNLAKRLGKDATTWAGTTTTIEEPIITFRHLFHLVSGKTFADENMADAKGNRDYYINNRRYLTSFGDKDFMIRLEKDMPEEKDTKSAYYYKDSEDTDNAYKRVRGYEIRTYKIDNYTDIDDEQTTELSYNGIAITAGNLGGDKDMFKPTERSIFSHISSDIQTDVDQAKWLKNGKNFYRAIGCDKDDINPGTYMVRIYGKDASGAIITLPGSNGSSVPLVIAEYQITFLDPAKYEASFESEETLNGKDASKTKEENEKNAKNYYTHTEDYLEGHFNKDGKSSLVVNFDNYKYLKDPKYSSYEFFKEANRYNGDTKTLAASYLKLPIAWDDSNYGFGYTTRGDYNMFVLGDHSVITPYKDAADAKKDNPVDIETGVAYTGTYDRLFYNSEGTEKGLFYYVNAASDPGDMAKIQFGELCPGSTIYVSAWVNEFNNGQEETANVIFNFYANISNKTDKTHKIIRQDQIHGFVTGYIDRGTYISQGNTNNYRDGDQGKWMHVYYTFVPDLDRAQYTGDEEVLSYTLVLENNCISSSGADYAIDDIRAYVVEPRVEARQSTPVCNRDHPDDIEVEVMIPFASLYETLKDVIDDKTEIMQLQYSVLDKKVYDEYVTTHKNDANQTGVYQQAFSNSVLHYPHDNIQRSPETDKDKPLSWGTIEFLANFKDYFVYDKDGNITTDDNGNPVKSDKAKTVGSEGQMIDEEEMLVFKTKIHSSDEKQYNDDFDPNHRDYYIVIGNLGTTGLFEDVVGKENSDNKYNADVYPSQTNDGKFVKPTDENNNWEKYDKVLAAKYDFGSKCVRISEFTLKGASDIIVDGIVYNDVDNITCCENQRPVVQIDLYKMDKDKNIDKSTPPEDNKLRANPYIDWYYGSYEKFMEETMDNTTISLWQVITIFRKEYPVATTWDVEVPKGEFTQQMKDYLKTMCEPKQETVTKDGKTVTVTRPAKVQLHTSSFIFPELTLKDEFGETLKDAQGHILTSREVYVTAIPDANLWEDNPWAIVCTEPTEIKITVSNTSPEMLNGFGSGITYPKDMNVVPLRSGLVHLDKTGIDGGEWKLDEYTTTEKDNKPLNISAYENQQTLVIPLRNLAVATQGVKQFKHIESDPYCYLAETNDPYYRRLGQVTYVRPMSVSTGSGETGNDTPATQAETDEAGKLYDSEFGLTPRGVITLDAATTDNHFSNVKITFNKTDMKFHEGYYYTFKFAYEEDYSTDGVQKPAIKEDEPCKGQTLFTIKVVPEYQKWTGDASLNWNNDENWKRVTKDDLLVAADKNVPSGKTANDYRFTINDDDISNENEFAYAPLDFTKVIIPAGATYPQLAARQHDRTGTTGGNISIKNGHGNAAVSYVWAAAVADTPDSNAPKAATATGNESAEDATETAPSYLPTRYVQYDMAAVMYPAGTSYEPNVYCRPWYANACEQIHFNSNAEILNQQNLDYQKAWVDMEMKPDQWYNVASPLYGVVAGDMYLPTQGARQQTELFTDITFDTAVNDRFHPAVFQRGWDKGNETVYNIEGAAFPGCPKVETVALASTWSHVYNDVADQYKVGTGYSVKTDVSRYEDVATNTKFDGLVKFRFPKADIDYDYYTDKNESHRENGTSVNRTDKHKLYSFANNGQVTLTKATDGNLFLVGNPFMAHLDMAKFLEKNKNVITPKYWLLSEGEGQVGVVMDRKNETAMLTNETLTAGDNITATSSTGGKLPPMQGFFVQATNKGKNLTLTFTPDMMAVEAYTDNAGNPLIKAPAHGTRAADDDDIISVTTGESTAIIRLSADAEKGYAASEDVEMIDDSNQRGMRRIYTTAGTMAAAINQTPDADGVEVGLMAPADSVTMVTFNGAALEDYLLYDTATGEMTQLFDGFELEMKGNVSGRYFLTSGIDTKEIEDGTIRIVPARREVVVTAPAVCGDLTVRVYDTLGREIATAEGFSEEVRIALDPGIYVIDASGSEKGHKAAKISIR